MKWPTHDEVLSRENFVILWLLLMARDFFFRDNYSCKVVLNSQVTCIIPLQYGQKKTGKRGALFSLSNLAFLYCLYALAFLSFICSRLCLLLFGYPSYRCLAVQWNPDILNPQFFKHPNNLNSHFHLLILTANSQSSQFLKPIFVFLEVLRISLWL